MFFIFQLIFELYFNTIRLENSCDSKRTVTTDRSFIHVLLHIYTRYDDRSMAKI